MSLSSLMLQSCEGCLPFKTLTQLSGRLAQAKMGAFTTFLIKNFIQTFNINLEECANPDPAAYATFNDFFIRKLKEGVRPVAQDCKAVCPADGTMGASGTVKEGTLIQAKGIDYALIDLVGGDRQDAALFEEGGYATVYLSPSNYHRVHMPLKGTLLRTVHIPGKLYPVGQRNIAGMPGLYTKNERLVCFFDCEGTTLALILVGAALVGSIGTVWDGTVIRTEQVTRQDLKERQLILERGAEMGHFKYGSTVIVLWPSSLGRCRAELTPGTPVQMGQSLVV